MYTYIKEAMPRSAGEGLACALAVCKHAKLSDNDLNFVKFDMFPTYNI